MSIDRAVGANIAPNLVAEFLVPLEEKAGKPPRAAYGYNARYSFYMGAHFYVSRMCRKCNGYGAPAHLRAEPF